MIWVDAQLSPAIADQLRQRLQIEAQALRDVGLRDAEDQVIFQAARLRSAAILTKDQNFADLVQRSDRGRRSSGSAWAIPAMPC